MIVTINIRKKWLQTKLIRCTNVGREEKRTHEFCAKNAPLSVYSL